MSEQSEFAALLFGSTPEVPADVSAAMFEHTFTDSSWVDDGSTHDQTSDLVPGDFDSTSGDEGDVTTDDDAWADDSWDHTGSDGVHPVAADASDDPTHVVVGGEEYDPTHHTDDHTDHHTDDGGYTAEHAFDDHSGEDDGWSGDLI